MSLYPKPVAPSAPAPPQPHKWIWPPEAGWGVLQIGQSAYVVNECHFEHENGQRCFCVRLKRHGADMDYQVCQDRDNELRCDCPDSVYRGRECKHVAAVRDAYAELDRANRLAAFLVGPDDPAASLAAKGWETGPPARLSAETVQIDANAAARMLCGGCRKRGLTFQPLHRGEQYAATAECPRCHFVEQV
jgi:hypothetical protein